MSEDGQVKYGRLRLDILATLLEPLQPGRLLDLGCGHGKASMLAQEMGWKVTAVDVRTKRFPYTEGIRWVQADVRTFKIKPGKFDCILILGLLYHLELNDVLHLLERCSSTRTIVDTHVTLRPDREELGYRGWYFDELAGRTKERHSASPTASWGNEVAFWPDEESLIRMFHDSGFEGVLKWVPGYREDRTFWLCLPPR